jgi:hypothetical protein
MGYLNTALEELQVDPLKIILNRSNLRFIYGLYVYIYGLYNVDLHYGNPTYGPGQPYIYRICKDVSWRQPVQPTVLPPAYGCHSFKPFLNYSALR